MTALYLIVRAGMSQTGGTAKTCGARAARLAGVLPTVIERAREVLTQVEGTAKSPARTEKSERVQLTLFEADEPPALKELRATDVDTLSAPAAGGSAAQETSRRKTGISAAGDRHFLWGAGGDTMA